jgi:aspartyl-tRNA(Asn)/glutamyl-tRNA(Gln) amidotransferase subunit A
MAGITDLGVAAIRDGFRRGDFSAREVATAFNGAVEKARGLNAFVVETPDHALAAADAADQARASGDLKPLSGVPLGIKDLFSTKGVQTTAGSHMLGGYEPVLESTGQRQLCSPPARACSASSTWTSSRWARPTRPRTTAMSSPPGGARTAATRR